MVVQIVANASTIAGLELDSQGKLTRIADLEALGCSTRDPVEARQIRAEVGTLVDALQKNAATAHGLALQNERFYVELSDYCRRPNGPVSEREAANRLAALRNNGECRLSKIREHASELRNVPEREKPSALRQPTARGVRVG